MGSTYEINVWNKTAYGYDWLQIYAGNNIIKTIYCLWKAKRQGYKCIKFEYRPN